MFNWFKRKAKLVTGEYKQYEALTSTARCLNVAARSAEEALEVAKAIAQLDDETIVVLTDARTELDVWTCAGGFLWRLEWLAPGKKNPNWRPT